MVTTLADSDGFEPSRVLPPQISNLLQYHYANYPFLVLTMGVEPTPVRILSPMRLPVALRKHILESLKRVERFHPGSKPRV